jgi:division protein CdvB (Snf7/Vps24/ESCRT-III family)
MARKHSTRRTRCNRIAPELAELRKISTQLDSIELRLDTMQSEAVKGGAIAGAAAGAVTGGIVAAGLAMIKARLGF